MDEQLIIEIFNSVIELINIQIFLAFIFGIIIPFIFNKMTKSDDDIYGMIIVVAVVGGFTSSFYYTENRTLIDFSAFWYFFVAPIFGVLLSFFSFFKKSWSIDKLFYKSLIFILCVLITLLIYSIIKHYVWMYS